MLAFPMKLNTLLEYLLKEAIRPEAPEDAPLGRYLFAPQRIDTPEPKEPNTDEEENLLRKLASFYNADHAGKNIDSPMKKLFDLQNTYPKLLKPAPGLAYRFIGGMKPEEASVLYLNNLPVEEIIAEPNKAFYVEPIGMVKNPAAKTTMSGMKKTKLSSWTAAPTSPNFSSFAKSYSGQVSVVIVADIASNSFFMNPKNLSKTVVSGLPASLIDREKEVIGYGPINVLEAAAIYIGDSTFGYEVRGDLFGNTPEIPMPYYPPKGAIFKPEVFKPAFDYVENTVSTWEKKVPRKFAKKMREFRPYLLLKQCATNGFVSDGTSATYHSAAAASDAIYLITELIIEAIGAEDMDGNGDNTQAALLKALSLKIKKY